MLSKRLKGPGFLKMVSTAALALFFGSMALAVDTTAATFKPFTLKAMDGGEFNTEGLKNFPLSAVVFFATWNPKSAAVLVELQKLADKYEKNSFAALAVNSESEKTDPNFRATLEKYLKDNNITMTVLVDEGLAAYRSLEIKAVPTTFLLDKDMNEVLNLAGAPTSYNETVEEAIMVKLGLKPSEAEKKDEVKRYRPADRALTLQYGMIEKKAERGKVEAALTELDELIKKDDKFADAYALKGLLLFSDRKGTAEQKKSAQESFDKAAALDATLPLALIGQAHFAIEGGDLKKASELLNTAFAQSNWGTRDKPENLADLKKGAEEAAGKVGKDDAAAKTALAGLVEPFLVAHAGPKVNMKKMEDAAKK